jgi:hypothetical protein
MKPTGWLLSGNRKGALRRWPDSTKPLIQFERSHPVLDHLLESECHLSRGPIWLFRIGSDGTAREIIGRVVRPGCAYIVVTTGELPQARVAISLCKLDCEGVKSYRLAVPPHVSAEMTAWLQAALGLQVARTIRVWPAGLPARNWDGEGSGEWLTTEAPCFGIAHDHSVESYVFSLNNGPESVVPTVDTGHHAFVRIAPLPAGVHSLVIKARRSRALDGLAQSPSAEGFVQLRVREPEPWTPGVAAHPGLIVTIDPHDPDLDTFWRNEVGVSVIGPESHAVSFIVSLEAADGREILSEQVGGPADLPVTPEAWRRRFGQFLQHENYAWSYLEAASGTLAIEGETLGRCSLRFEHGVQPLRWVLREDHGKVIVRLVDDSGEGQSKPEVHVHSMEHPLKPVSLAPEMIRSGFVVNPPGGLFQARHGAHSDSVVVSAGLTGEGLRGLSVRPSFAEALNGSVPVSACFRALEQWRNARQAGFLSKVRCEQVNNGLIETIYEILYGSEWKTAEAIFHQHPNSPKAIDRLQNAVHTHRGFAAVLRRDYQKVGRDLGKTVSWYKALAKRYELHPQRFECKFAFELAWQPQRLFRTFGADFEPMLEALARKPAILRGARFLKLISTTHQIA